MGNKSGHLEKASHNEKFLRELMQDKNAFVDWMVIVAFYVALHFVDAALAGLNIHPENHPYRNREVCNNFRNISTKYVRLYEKSRYLRYEVDSHKYIPSKEANYLCQSALNNFRSIV